MLCPLTFQDNTYIDGCIRTAPTALDQAPTFAAGDYPDFADRQWQQESRGYFLNGAAATPGVTDRERSPGMQQDRSPGLQQEQTPRGGAQDGAMTPREGTREGGTTPRGSDAR